MVGACDGNCSWVVDYPKLKEIQDKQEQKPAEYLSKEKVFAIMNKLTSLSFCVPLGSDEEEKIHEITCDVSSLLDYSIEPKPNEWSEEDEEKRDDIVKIIEYSTTIPAYGKTGILKLSKEYKKELTDWFRSLRPQPRKEIYQAAKHDLAIRFMNYLDENRPEGKMSLSEGECGDIDKAFKENDWTKIIGYAKKYQILQEKKPEAKLTGWVARDRNEEIYVYFDYPERDFGSSRWTGGFCRLLDQESFPNIKWEDEPIETEITIKRR